MGIDTKWKKVLDDNFGYCYLYDIPEGTEIDLVVDDMSLNIRSVLYGIQTWDELGMRLRTRVENMQTKYPSLKRYVVTFDEPKYVPVAKQPEQRKRDRIAKNKKRKRLSNTGEAETLKPLNAEEMKALRIEKGAEIPEPKDEFIDRLMITRGTHSRLYRFCLQELFWTIFIQYEEDQTVDLLTDGCSITLDDINDQKEIGTKVLNENESEIDLDEGKQIYTLTRKTDSEAPSIYINKSNLIGESDIKIPKHVTTIKKGNIYIISNDSDTILILLLNLRGWIDHTGMISYGVFVDTRTSYYSSKDKGHIVDIVSLWRSIIVKFKEQYPGITCPIETMVLLMLLTGSDYVDSFSQLGPARIWDAFTDRGHNVLFNYSQSEYPPIDVHADSIKAIITETAYGNPNYRTSITFAENKIYAFIEHAYFRCLAKKDGIYTDPAMKFNRILARDRNRNLTTTKEQYHWKIPSDQEITAEIRRVWWQMDYLTNGTKTPSFMDPTAMHPKTGLSLHGWENIVNAHETIVEPAKRVHTFSELP